MVMDFFDMPVDDAFLNKERRKARELRQSQWWKRKRSTGICHYCNHPFPPRELTMDHIVPLARGGRSVKSNVVPCCKACNTFKKQMVPMEWDSYMASLKPSA